MFEITGGIPEPIFDEPQEAESLGRTWQALIGSQTLRRRSSARYEKGTGDPPKRHQRGNISKTRIEIFRSGFFRVHNRDRNWIIRSRAGARLQGRFCKRNLLRSHAMRAVQTISE